MPDMLAARLVVTGGSILASQTTRRSRSFARLHRADPTRTSARHVWVAERIDERFEKH
jgi:hypothetical protein